MDLLSLLGAGGTVATRARTAALRGTRAGEAEREASVLARLKAQQEAEDRGLANETERLQQRNVLDLIRERNEAPTPEAPRSLYVDDRGGFVTPGQPFQPVEGLPAAAKPTDPYEERAEGGGTAIYEGGRFSKWKIPPPQTAPTRAQLPTGAERKNAGLYRTGKLGYDTLERLVTVQDDPTTPKIESGNRAAPRLRDRIVSKFGGGVGNFLSSDELRQQDQAAYDLSEAWLRLTSGAVIGPEEIKNSARAIIPQPGDDDATLTQKRHARKARIDAIRASAGRAVDPNVVGQEPDETDGLDAQIDAVLGRRP